MPQQPGRVLGNLSWRDIGALPYLAGVVELNDTVNEREQRVIAPDTHVSASVNLRPALSDDDRACAHGLTAEPLHAQAL
jgi:hypothetical protein